MRITKPVPRRRTLARALTGLLLGTALMLVVTPPALASDTRVDVTHAHANGAGATAARVTGAPIVWFNRSVDVDNVTLYVAPNHCAQFEIVGVTKDVDVPAWYRSEPYCATTTPRTVTEGKVHLEAGGSEGGIRTLEVYAIDVTHDDFTVGFFRR